MFGRSRKIKVKPESNGLHIYQGKDIEHILPWQSITLLEYGPKVQDSTPPLAKAAMATDPLSANQLNESHFLIIRTSAPVDGKVDFEYEIEMLAGLWNEIQTAYNNA